MKKIIILFFLFSFLCPFVASANHQEDQVLLVVKSSSHSLFQTTLQVSSDKVAQALLHAQLVGPTLDVPMTTSYVLLKDKGIVRIFAMDSNAELYDVKEKQRVVVPSAIRDKLMSYFEEIQDHHFGKLYSWKEVDQLIPRYTSFMITDLESGLNFEAQRRAGSSHADVQPLTEKDTKIMKEIYDGKWSWKRRAILIHHNDEKIAASMHGMPHGGGALANGFPGHFCIHFKDSVTHASKSLDLAHQIMVYKAGGLLTSFVQQLSPKEIIELFFIALNQQDLDLLNLIYHDKNGESIDLINEVESIRVVHKKNRPSIEGPYLYEIPLTFLITKKGEREVGAFYTFRVKRESPTSNWKLEQVPVDILIK
ncbi:hypothetical protein ACFFHM_19275 [Halalkalibacter kiskunsagensis]|uniref:Uncharacterized protein n=1 Tax=Halalkalibacter kiskunsagensis TaxID=1548599 RepID=A0ABV6KGY2_9BACI